MHGLAAHPATRVFAGTGLQCAAHRRRAVQLAERPAPHRESRLSSAVSTPYGPHLAALAIARCLLRMRTVQPSMADALRAAHANAVVTGKFCCACCARHQFAAVRQNYCPSKEVKLWRGVPVELAAGTASPCQGHGLQPDTVMHLRNVHVLRRRLRRAILSERRKR